jgi:hypothetical protein
MITDFIRQCSENQTTDILFTPLFSDNVTAGLALAGLQTGEKLSQADSIRTK